MALIIADRVREITSTTGTGTVSLAGAATGYQSFAVVGDGNQTYYTIADQVANEWEVGIGTYYSGNTSLSRDTVLASSNAGSLADFGIGAKDVFVTYPAEEAVYLSNGNVTPNLGNVSLVSINFGDGSQQTTAGLPSLGNNSIVALNTNITANTTINAGVNGFSVGPVYTANGVSVTVSSGQRWVVV